jgi:HK97 family phage major capsid protein
MHTKNMTEVQADLQGLLDEVGVDEFPRVKALYMKDVAVVDEDGRPVDLDDVEVEITLADEVVDEIKGEHDEEDEKAAHEDDEDSKKSYHTEEERKRNLGIKIAMHRTKPGDHDRKPERKSSEEVSEAVEKAVSKAISKNVSSKGFDMRIDNDREGMTRWGSLKHFSHIQVASGDPELEAYKFGRWAAACMGHRKSMDWCDNRGIQVKAHLETVNSQGGFLVPDEFSDALISLREQYGVLRRNAKIEPMISDTKRIPKRSATLTASFVGEATAGSETTQTFEQVTLVAKKLMVLSTISNELNEDSLINLGDSIAGECAYAMAKREDECGFQGDGTSSFGGIVGVVHAINAVSSNAGIETLGGTDATVAAIELADFNNLMARLPAYADTPRTKFYMHKSVYHAAAERLAFSKGTTTQMIFDGQATPTFFGYPVEFTQVMPTSATADGTSADLDLRYPIIFGDLALASAFGDRRDNTISFSDSALNAFEQDEIVVRATERFDYVCHSPGTSSEAGPVVAMKLD